MTPKTAAFVSPKRLKHAVCGEPARAFTNRAAASNFARKSGKNVLNLAQLNELVK